MIRVGRLVVPVQTAFAAFFATILFFLLTVLRPVQVYVVWALALVMACVALAVFTTQALFGTGVVSHEVSPTSAVKMLIVENVVALKRWISPAGIRRKDVC